MKTFREVIGNIVIGVSYAMAGLWALAIVVFWLLLAGAIVMMIR